MIKATDKRGRRSFTIMVDGKRIGYAGCGRGHFCQRPSHGKCCVCANKKKPCRICGISFKGAR
jgi:hypothetical protein